MSDQSRRDFLKNLGMLGALIMSGISLLKSKKVEAAVIRPPGSIAESDFLARCIRCGRCGDVCPNQAIQAVGQIVERELALEAGIWNEGTPIIFPRQKACNLCNGIDSDVLLCTSACPTGALELILKDPQVICEKVNMGTATVDTNLCYSYNGASCGVCINACPFEGKALKAGFMEQPIVDEAYCVGCGLCERACIRYPQAISVIPNYSRVEIL